MFGIAVTFASVVSVRQKRIGTRDLFLAVVQPVVVRVFRAVRDPVIVAVEFLRIGIRTVLVIVVQQVAVEVLVGFLQAYIFTILAAVYIGGAAHPEH